MRHAKELSKTLRDDDQQEARALGHDPRKATFFAFRHGVLRKTALVEGKVAAMWGVCGSLLGQTGQPYLITGTEVSNVSSHAFAKIYRKEVLVMQDAFPILENYVDYRYEGAIRMLRLAGFRITGPYPMEPHGMMFLKFRREI